jgi:hypothetical protein
MPKLSTKSKKPEYTMEERYARADAKEAKNMLAKQIKRGKRDTTVKKQQNTLDRQVETLKKKHESKPSASTVQPAVIQPAVIQPAVIQPTVIQPAVIQPAVIKPVQDSDDEVFIVEPAPANVEPAPAVCPDDIETESDDN